MKRYARLYMKFLAQYMKGLMEYKSDFILGLIGFFFTQGAGILFIYLIFQRIPALNGWSFYQLVFIYGFAQLPRGLDHLFADNLWLLAWRTVVKGEFDRYLLRPINPLFQLLAERFQPEAFGELIIGVILVVVAAAHLQLTLTPLMIAAFIFVTICGSVIYTAVKLFFASIAFWTKVSGAILFMNYSFSDFAKYPMTAYSRPIRFILTFIVPFAFTAYFPAGLFVGKIDWFTAVAGTFIAAVVSFTIAYFTWLKGIAAYESAGS